MSVYRQSAVRHVSVYRESAAPLVRRASITDRILSWWTFDAFLSRFRAYRRLRGGHWEQWWIDMPVCSTMWLRNEHGKRPGLGAHHDACEDYGP